MYEDNPVKQPEYLHKRKVTHNLKGYINIDVVFSPPSSREILKTASFLPVITTPFPVDLHYIVQQLWAGRRPTF